MEFSPAVRELLRSANNPRYVPNQGSDSKLDPKLCFLSALYNAFGEPALLAVMNGLSRPIKPTREDVTVLIDQWERRDSRCCYNGTVKELCGLKDTWIFAVSYRHAPLEEWGRKDKREGGPSTLRICKFRDQDQELLKNVVTKLPGDYFVMLWCDQVLSTRFKSDASTTPWYLAGLLPYATFSVLQLSTHLPTEDLENRVWIRAERSLGRMGYGFLEGNEASLGVGAHPGKGQDPSGSLRNVAKMILSGYWPEDPQDYWKIDFELMRKWALGVLCRGEKHLLDLPLFETHEEVDNIEILNRMDKFASIPPWLESEEPVRTTPDKKFFLKATAWNLTLKEHCWDVSPGYVCHHMGNLGDTRFSWWQAEGQKYLFGIFADIPKDRYMKPTMVIAAETSTGTGYQVYRCTGDLTQYRHAEPSAGPETRKMIEKCAEKARFQLPDEIDFKLLYTSDDSLMNARTLHDIENELGEAPLHAEVMVPLPFQGMTTKLFESVAKCSEIERVDVARKLVDMTEEWNEGVRQKYSEWLSVKDTMLGPIWLEGIDQKDGIVSFGYLEHITERLLLGRVCESTNSVSLRTPREAICDIREKKNYMKRDEVELAREIFETVDEEFSEEKFSVRDVARYTLSGGFSSHFRTESPRHFLAGIAESRGYWSTLIVCRSRKIQIRFRNEHGENRIAQRPSTLDAYAGIGFVHPSDAHAVQSVSELCHDEDKRHFMLLYWKDMRDTTSREDLCKKFPNSIRKTSGDCKILGVDMTIGENDKPEQQLIHADNLIEFHVSFSETEHIFDGSHSEAYWSTAHQMAELDNYLAEPSLEKVLEPVLNIERIAGETLRLVKENESGENVISDSEMERLLSQAQAEASRTDQLLRDLQTETEQEDVSKKIEDILRNWKSTEE